MTPAHCSWTSPELPHVQGPHPRRVGSNRSNVFYTDLNFVLGRIWNPHNGAKAHRDAHGHPRAARDRPHTHGDDVSLTADEHGLQHNRRDDVTLTSEPHSHWHAQRVEACITLCSLDPPRGQEGSSHTHCDDVTLTVDDDDQLCIQRDGPPSALDPRTNSRTQDDGVSIVRLDLSPPQGAHNEGEATISLAFVESLRQRAIRDLERAHTIRDKAIGIAAAAAGQVWPRAPGSSANINRTQASVLAGLVADGSLSLGATVRLLRGESIIDPRPNKALRPEWIAELYTGYKHYGLLLDMAHRGIVAPLVLGMPGKPPTNHKSAKDHIGTLAAKVGEGQRDGTYLVVTAATLPRWPDVICSPFGLVQKGSAPLSGDGRLIHDLSFPRGSSVNDHTLKGCLPDVCWQSVMTLCTRINMLADIAPPGVVMYGRCGDVKSAFRHLPLHWSSVAAFGNLSIELDALVIDMALPFGWTGSPKYYSVIGNGMSWLVGQQSPNTINPHLWSDAVPFFAYEWVDDHIFIELDTPGRLLGAELTFRLTLLATLGPHALNEAKYPPWATSFKALGLIWDLHEHTVSMPAPKIQKARLRVLTLLVERTSSKTAYLQVLGSLRHVCSCLPPARPFFQRIHAIAHRTPPYGQWPVPDAVRLDLEWFASILANASLVSIPTSVFAHATSPDIVLQMDASDEALVVLDGARRRYIRLLFDDEERANIALTKSGVAIHASGRTPAPTPDPPRLVNFPPIAESSSAPFLGWLSGASHLRPCTLVAPSTSTASSTTPPASRGPQPWPAKIHSYKS